jgi:hypothetical protein
MRVPAPPKHILPSGIPWRLPRTTVKLGRRRAPGWRCDADDAVLAEGEGHREGGKMGGGGLERERKGWVAATETHDAHGQWRFAIAKRSTPTGTGTHAQRVQRRKSINECEPALSSWLP